MKIVALLAALALAGPARGEAARRAEAAFEAGDYETAAKAAAKAYADEGDPVFLYVRAQAERFGGDCESALIHYREFIEAVPNGPATQAARDNIKECEQAVAEVPPEPTGTTTSSTEPEVEADPIDPLIAGEGEDHGAGEELPSDGLEHAREGPRWYRDPWGGALVGVGVVALAAGGGLYGQAQIDARAAREADDVFAYGERIDRAYVLSRVGIPVLAVGGALVVAGVVRWSVVARRARRDREGRLGLSPGGVVLRW